MLRVGDLVTLRSQGSRTAGTGVILEVQVPWAIVSWSWADGRVGRYLLMDLRKVSETCANDG